MYCLNIVSNGNLLYDTFHAYTWDADGDMQSVDGTSLTYDALGRMVERGTTVLLMGPTGSKPLATMSGLTVNERFVPLPGGAMMRSNWGYRHGDWLGSVRLLSSFSQTTVYDSAYAPFGESYAATGSNVDVGFTQGTTDSLGQLSASGIYDFDFRKLHRVQGRWLSPDPAGMAAADSANPQSWNRYAYVMNSPLNYVDPRGMNEEYPCDGFEDCGGGGGYCPPEYENCDDPFPPPVPIGPPDGGGGGGHGGGRTTPTSSGPVGTTWPDNETLGLPGGLNVHPLSLVDFFGLTPGTSCEFGPCGAGPNTFAGGGGDPATQIKSLYENILEHLEKIAADPNNPAVQHWNAEIENWSRQILKKAESA
jgi:RHS repeat-associated protein